MDPEPRRKPLPRPKGTGKGEFVPQRAWARLTAYRQCSPCALGHGDSGGGHGELSPVPGLQLGPAQLMLHGGGRRCRAGARGGEGEGHKQPGGCFPPSWTTATRETCELLGFEWCPQPPKQHRGCWDFTWPVHEGIPEEAEHSLALGSSQNPLGPRSTEEFTGSPPGRGSPISPCSVYGGATSSYGAACRGMDERFAVEACPCSAVR